MQFNREYAMRRARGTLYFGHVGVEYAHCVSHVPGNVDTGADASSRTETKCVFMF